LRDVVCPILEFRRKNGKLREEKWTFPFGFAALKWTHLSVTNLVLFGIYTNKRKT
jgi:hypothetical protein